MQPIVAFPSGPKEDERIERVSSEADKDKDLAGYIVLFVVDGGVSFKFAVPRCPALTDQMIGAIDRVKKRLIEYQEGDR